MVLDVRGSLKNTKVNRNPYVVVDELLSNGIDSFLQRKNAEPSFNGLKVRFDVVFLEKDLDGNAVDLEISCTDNGYGLGELQTKAFVTKDTSFKDDLGIPGIGKCRGSGRIQYFHYFTRLEIDSKYVSEGKYFRKTLSAYDNIKEISPDTFKVKIIPPTDLETKFTLKGVKQEIYEKYFSGDELLERFSAASLKSYVFISFMQRLIGLKQQLGDFSIVFSSNYKGVVEHAELNPTDLPVHNSKTELSVHYLDEKRLPTTRKETLSVFHYKLDGKSIKLRKNTVALCGKSTIVKDVTSNFLKMRRIENNPIDGFYHIVMIESDYLDSYVNEQRDGFDIPDKSDSGDLFLKNLISMEEILNSINDSIMEMLTPPDWDKDMLVSSVGDKFGISSTMIAETSVRVHYGDTEETVAKRVLSYYQQEAIKDTSEIFEIKEEIAKAEPHTDDFRDMVNKLAWKYTASLKSIDMVNLSQLVVRRVAMLEILALAIGKKLNFQTSTQGVKRIDEKLIHNIFFPMQKDSTEAPDHDIWILNEEYQYFDYIASDKCLSKIRIDGCAPLFDPSIDEELQKILSNRTFDNRSKRPDIAIFSKEGAAIIIEFKSPDVSLDDHTGDLMEYAHLLAAKSNGKIKQFYGYLIGTELNPLRLRGYTKFPSGWGYFGTERIEDPATRQTLGELYSELLHYDEVVTRAQMRLQVYKDRLNLTV